MSPNLKVLVADDNPDHIQLITEILNQELKAEVEGVTKGEECLKRVKNNRYDLLLLDYRFPEISGMDILKEIVEKGYNLPIIMISGYGNEKVAVEAMKAGAIDYIVKSEDGFQSLPFEAKMAIEKDQLRKKLRQSEEKFQNLFESAPDAIIYLDRAGRILEANKQAVEVFGVSKPELPGKQLIRLGVFPPREIPAFLNSFADILAGREVTQDLCIKNKKGQEIPLECSSSLTKTDDKVTGVMFIARDITERKRAQEALLESERNLKEAQRLGRIGHWEFDPGTQQIHWSDMVFALYERDPKLGPPSAGEEAAYYSPEDAERLRNIARRTIETGEPYEVDARLRLPGGRYADVVAIGTPVKDAHGRVVKLLGTVQDITERKRAEETLRNREGVLQKIFDILPLGLWFADKDGKLLRGNPAGVKIWGAEPKVGPSEYGVFKARRLPSGEEVAPDDWALAHTIRDKVTIVDELLEIDAFDGKKKTILNYTAPVLDAQGDVQGAIVVNQDITERRHAEEDLRQSHERLRSLAAYLESALENERTRIARELHDELGQVLTALKIDLVWIIRRMQKDDVAGRAKTDIMRGLIDDTIDTVRRISTQLRPGLLDDMGLAAAIEWQTKEFAGRAALEYELALGEEDIVLDKKLATALFRIYQETLINVVRHAGATRIRVSLEAGPDELVMTICDNGKGITESQEADQKSLGLIGMRERIRAWGGVVMFQGVAGQGTTVTVRVPYSPGNLRT